MRIRTQIAPDGRRYCFTTLRGPFLVSLLAHLATDGNSAQPIKEERV